jgi:phosphoinositide-3-kinase regulatory subunit 4
MLMRISTHLSCEHRLDRLLPYLLLFIRDESAGIRALAIESIAELLEEIEELAPINARLFAEYLLPYMRVCVVDEEVHVRVTYAQNVAQLGTIAERFKNRALQSKPPPGDAAYITARDTILE